MLAWVLLLGVFSPALAFQCTSDGYFPDPANCAKYYQCVNMQPYNQDCPAGLQYNAKNKQCDWPANVDCNAKPAPGPEPTSAPAPAPEPVPDPDPQPNPQPGPAGSHKIVCYFPNWAGYRKEGGKYTPANIDANLCTHIVYAFAVLDESTNKIKAFDSWADLDLGYYKNFVDLKKKNPNLKAMLAIGGWTDSAGSKYSKMISNQQSRKTFNEDVVQFLKKYNFDGLDLDWEYPGCPQGGCGASPSDKQNFGIWVKELRAIFDRQSPRMLLSAAVSASKNVIDNAYDVPAMASAMDHINIMAYDYHGPWESTTGQNAPFRAGPGMDSTLTTEYSMKYWQQKGAPASKLVMGLPAYGKSFTLANAGNNGFGAAARGAGKAGEFTGEGGLLAYYEICNSLKSGWKKGGDANAGPYAYSGDQWVGYDDPATIAKKTKWAKEGGYGGVMVWDIAMDDFTGNCCGVKNPLLQAMNFELLGKGTSASTMKCQ